MQTVQFSSHAGYPGWQGRAFDAGMIDEVAAGLDAIGALARCDGLLTGYLGRVEIGEAALRVVAAVRAANSKSVYACDPVIGDTGKGVYVADGVPEFFRDRALPAAAIASPNAFELAWLTGLPLGSLDEARTATRALRRLGPEVVLTTSLALDDTPADSLDMLVADGKGAWRLRTPRLPVSVNGAGDLLSALFLFHWLTHREAPQALASAAASVFGVVAATAAAGQRELMIVAAQEEFVRPSRRFVPEPV